MSTAFFAAVLAALVAVAPAAPTSLRPPVDGPVLARFDATGTYTAGHRGIDLAAVAATRVRAPVAGRVTFAGTVAGNLTVSIDTGVGLIVHLSYLGALEVSTGEGVAAGAFIGLSGRGHRRGPGVHLGVEIGGIYVDPLPLLARRRAILVR